MLAAPDLAAAHDQLPAVLKLLTQISMESMADLIPDSADADALLAQHYQRVSALCAQVQLDAGRMNPRWNKTYGDGGTKWAGALADGRGRGDLPYYCPSGWARFALNVCPDVEFEDRFDGWGYLYHGTKGRYVGSILTSGFRASKGLCFCGKDDHAIYMSPSIEYCSHPRYGCIEYNPESRQWMQIVFQCRVDPKAVWQIKPETLRCAEYGLRVDGHVSNDRLEWLFKPNFVDPQTGDKFVRGAIVCTGIMVRVTKDHPLDLPYWWSKDPAYTRRMRLRDVKVEPEQSIGRGPSWIAYADTVMVTFAGVGDPSEDSYKIDTSAADYLGDAWLSPAPFANGSMRYAWYLRTDAGLYVVKWYNDETKRHIAEGLGLDTEAMLLKDARTYLAAQYYAEKVTAHFTSEEALVWWNWYVKFVQPCAFKLGGEWVFGEPFLKGKFVKWNTNTGENNPTAEASESYLGDVAAFYSHYTYCASKGKLMVVDVQGLVGDRSVVFTDPQIHTRTFQATTKSRRSDKLYKRFSIGNLGRTGMARFFANHTCGKGCKQYGLSHATGDFAFAPARRP